MGAIDIHAHGFPESFLRKLTDMYPEDAVLSHVDDVLIARWSKAPLPAFDLQTRLDEMARDRVDLEILSAPIIYGTLDDSTASLCRHLNDFQAEMARAEPERFRSFIHLPVHDTAASRAEIRRWHGAVEVVGIVLGSNMGGQYPGEPAMLPIWEAIAESGLPVFIHPNGPCGVSMPVMSPILMFPTDTGVAAASIIYAGLLERFPSQVIILSHYGGPLAMMARRLDMAYDNKGFAPGHGQQLPQAPSAYLPRFYVDTAQGFHAPAFDCARAVFGIEHMLYGTDHFLLNSTFRAVLNEFLDTLPLSASERYAIMRGNAERIIPRLG